MITRMLSKLAIAMLLLTLVITPTNTAKANDTTITQVRQAIEEVSEYITKSGVESEWEAIGLARAGKTVPKAYHENFNRNLQEQVISKSGKGRMKITDVERLAIAGVAIGKNPMNIDGKGFNLIEKIYNSESWTSGEDSITFQGNNGIIFALLALDSNGFEVPNTAKWTREKLIAELLMHQKEEGSWSLSTSKDGASSFDITAMALTALAPYDDQPLVKNAIDKAVSFLAKSQEASGGFNEQFVGGISSEATSQVIIGLTANKIDPESDLFTKKGAHLIDHLLSYQSEDGGFKHTIDDAASNGMASEQALQALVAFDLYVKGEGSLYDFTGETVTPLPESIAFTDVDGHWAIEFIEDAAQLNIIKGYPDGSFKPDSELKRVHAVSLLVRALNLETTKSSPFKDIGGYHSETQQEIAAAYHHGLIVNPNGSFNPNNNVTRAQMALMLERAYKIKTGVKYQATGKAPFSDFGNADEETINAISMLYELEIASGSNGKYNPSNSTTRAHAAKMLVNFFEKLD
ncbi:S-layer homology domain-containing protein [Sporosarcina sp. CAU 1771]